MSRNPDDNHTQRMRWQRVMMCVVMLLLALQLLGAGSHKHAFLDTSADCVTCHFVQHLPNGVAPVSTEIATTFSVLYFQPLALLAQAVQARPSFLIPDSQAPPRHLPA